MSAQESSQAAPTASRRVCPPGHARFLDHALRPILHSPRRLFGPHVTAGDTVLDIGCGGGFASMGLAGLVGPEGTVISVDLQPEMLEIVARKARRAGLEGRIRTHQCASDHIGVTLEVDFAVAFWMLHESPDPEGLLREVYGLLRPGGRFFIAEPTIHAPQVAFDAALAAARGIGYVEVDRPRVLMSRAVVLGRAR